ncbi:MAG: hypothetical protein HY787_03765 [Deltaproteobacteria bacterium]|nr:hypothetical protein [Deltaproteobacteria bacterium]
MRELIEWNIIVCIIKHRIPGHTFHPKIYLFEWDDRAEIIIGSNNFTEGGFFGNYEGCARISYKFPDDIKEFEKARTELKRFIDPHGPTAYELTDDFFKELIERDEVPTEAEARYGRDISRRTKISKQKRTSEKKYLFGFEDIEPPPPLPADLLERLIKEVRKRKKKREKPPLTRTKKYIPKSPIEDQVSDPLLPAAFYMTLPTLQGKNIPGEGRIPLEAIELAKDFWGRPNEYTKNISPRSGEGRVYWNWYPTWRIWNVETPQDTETQAVRMYLYENSSDFRFYMRPLVNAGADLGDVVRIRRIAQPDAEYECVLARKGTPEYSEWIKYCSQPVRNSTRRFGYA